MAIVATDESNVSANDSFVTGNAPSVQALSALIAQIARTDIPVLLIGESGTGKEVYARLIHQLSGTGPSVLRKVHCASPDAAVLLGKLRQEIDLAADGDGAGVGTIFLDGIHELDGASQKLLLSLLPDGEPKKHAGVARSRTISSTSRNLEQEIAAGHFLRELYFRINGTTLRLPPLRDRREDIPALLQNFFRKYSGQLDKPIPELSAEAQETLNSYDWPGNIRELENAAKKIIAIGDPVLALSDLRATQVNVAMSEDGMRLSPLKAVSRAASRQAERELIQKALERTRWNRKRAARDLQVSYKSLLYKIKLAGLDGKKPEQE